MFDGCALIWDSNQNSLNSLKRIHGQFHFLCTFSRNDFGEWLHGLAVCAVFGLSANVHAQTSWIGDVLIMLPDGQAYAEVQTAWTSTAETVSDSLTLTMIAFKATTLCRSKDKVLARPDVQDSSALLHVHVARLAVPRKVFVWSGS